MSNVSVIIPMYKCSSTIRQTLNSILAQSSLIMEIIVILDGYDSEIENIMNIEFLHPIITFIKQNENSGVANARNIGLKLAQSKFVAFCDADDVWHPDKLTKQLQYMNSGQDLVGTSAVRFSKDIELESYIDRKEECIIEKVVYDHLKVFNPFYFSSIIVRKDLIENIKFSENTPQEDYQFIIDIFREHKNIKSTIIKNPYIGYRVIEGSRSGSVFRSARNSFFVRKRNFGLILSMVNFPKYIVRVLRKRYSVTF